MSKQEKQSKQRNLEKKMLVFHHFTRDCMNLSPHSQEKRMQTLKVSIKLSYCQSLHSLYQSTDAREENFLQKSTGNIRLKY